MQCRALPSTAETKRKKTPEHIDQEDAGRRHGRNTVHEAMVKHGPAPQESPRTDPQPDKLYRHNRQGSYRTKHRYYEACKRFCTYLASWQKDCTRDG